MNDMHAVLERWQLDVKAVREHAYRAPTPRERERWHALWLLARGWSSAQVANALERDAHTIGDWVEDFRERGPAGVSFEQVGTLPDHVQGVVKLVLWKRPKGSPLGTAPAALAP